MLHVQDAGCTFVDEDGKCEAQTLGRIASFYYLKYQTLTVFSSFLQPAMTVQEVSPYITTKYGSIPVCLLCSKKAAAVSLAFQRQS